MTREFPRDAALALHRFGLGPRPGSIAAIASDPRGALLAELDRPGVGRIDDPELPTAAASSRAAFEARANIGDAWREAVVAIVTEFGRTARINGTDGTDHGTGTVAVLAGGALEGGRVIADWPGVKAASLYENRDLKATTDLRAVLKGVLKDHLRLDEHALVNAVFPGSGGVSPMAGLLI
jgi:uncharacterized protein (DUF1501 family)